MKNIILVLLSFHFSLSAQNNILNNKVDSIISLAIKQNAFPGAQIVVLKDSEEILNKSYGYHTYDSIKMVTNNSIYDLASITKPTARDIYSHYFIFINSLFTVENLSLGNLHHLMILKQAISLY